MKIAFLVKSIAVVTVLGFFTSCVNIYFTEVQPKGAQKVTEVPTELQGLWMNESGGVRIYHNGYEEIDISIDSLGVPDTSYRNIKLSNDVQLYQAFGAYILHVRDEGKPWEIVVLTSQKNGDVHIYSCDDPELFRGEKGLHVDSVTYNVGEEYVTYDDFRMKENDSVTIRAVTFSGQMKKKTFSKLQSDDYLISVLRKDGVYWVPDAENMESNE